MLSRVKYFLKKQRKEKNTKYKLLNKCLKHYQIALPQVKAGNRYENLLNEIRQIVYSLYQAKKLLKKYITM